MRWHSAVGVAQYLLGDASPSRPDVNTGEATPDHDVLPIEAGYRTVIEALPMQHEQGAVAAIDCS